jgi:hypothetical protein
MKLLNAIPVLGWIFAAVICLITAVPTYFLWNWLAPVYFYQLPVVYLSIPFFHIFGLLWLISTLRGLVMSNVAVSTNSNN